MNYKSKLFILGLISKIYAANFSVVSLQGDCQLEVGGQTYPMTKDEAVPLYKATADVPSGTQYKYICGGTPDVDRTLNGDKTYNELVGRKLTVYNMPEFGYPNAEPWTRSIGRTELFDPTYVPIVIIDAPQQFFVDGRGSANFNGISFILKENVFTFTNIPTSGKNGDEDKFQFKVTLPGDGIYHRTVLKFRPSSYDPVFFRQILYGDIAHAIGNPAHESVSARVYLSDGTPIGLYVLQEDCTTESFIKTAFFGDPNTGEIKDYEPNVIYDCATGADFTANDGKYLGAFKNNTVDLKVELLEMTQRLETLDVNNEAAVTEFDNNDLDLDTLFRALALEYLAGHWDSYWGLSTNFVTYHPKDVGASGYKFYFVDQDFDQTWSVGMYQGLDPQNYPNKSYKTLLFQNWKQLNGNEFDTETRVLVDRLLGCDGQPDCVTKRMFENHLQSIVQHIFNPVAMKRKTDGYKERLMEEMVWDTSLTRLHTGTNQMYHFTMDDFNHGIESADYLGSKFFYGILDWTTAICNTVCNEFQIDYDKTPYTPDTAAKVEAQPIDPGSQFDATATLQTESSDSIMEKVNIAFVTIATILSVVLFI
ncbi:hypothetical protein BCR32DRAFT_288298 [Anaeromyces robustus]|jgi:hypothetical protein|uniref:Coth-domain-containing protein n=1 Tax=Anaeromyces robustus TaxID=1754192 RepID=A0A1Y1V321_9FUNG|nr:hypothetical protein BCR32DRAFT_288298 [Anaeromyces robustus]|eukprot:ORX44741.1 hypothetical protein BCR32DRAFT_288298 [Anaeromyces robustus]